MLFRSKVEITIKSGEIYTLLPNEQLVYNHQNCSATLNTDVDCSIYTSWRDGYFIFENHTLKEIAGILGRWHDITIEFCDPNLGDMQFTGKMKKYHDLNEHLRMLEATQALQFLIDGKTIYIKNKN